MRVPEPRDRAPWHFRLAKSLIRRGVRGPGLAIRAAHRLGLLNCVVRYPIAGLLTVDVPLYRPDNWWDLEQVLSYEAPLIDTFVAAARKKPAPLRLVDCGAEIGLFSVLMAARLPEIEQVTAIEPDPAAFEILKTNIERLPMSGDARLAAVGETAGRGRLCLPEGLASEHTQFVVTDEGGPVAIERIDDLGLPRDGTLLLKLDVEGAELAALRGARQTLSEVSDFVVAIEAHSHVAGRTGIDPIECLRLLQSIRPCEFRIAERPDVRISTERDFFEQVEPGIYNVVCIPRG